MRIRVGMHIANGEREVGRKLMAARIGNTVPFTTLRGAIMHALSLMEILQHDAVGATAIEVLWGTNVRSKVAKNRLVKRSLWADVIAVAPQRA